ncbi:MAG TPA: V-type ATP synthase subunit E [Longimicrobiales bacterium]|nr:V-type ATP synthase subunit E [Longimicrobiales bacterium]
MALQELLDALRKQAEERRSAERARAEAEVDAIRTRSREGLERRRSDSLRRAREEARSAAQRDTAEARRKAARRLLTSREHLLRRVRGALERRVATAMDDPEYTSELRRVLESTLDRLPAGTVVVRTLPALESALAEAVAGRAAVRIEPVAGMGMGFSALSVESGMEVDVTLGTELELVWPRLAVAVMKEVGG